MSEWKFHSSRNHNIYRSKDPQQHNNNDENSSFNANRMSEINETQSVCSNSNNISSKYTPKITTSSDPFAARPKIGRTPTVLDTNINDIKYNNFNNDDIFGQSPAISSYFIPNTPIKYKQHQQCENRENKEEEPGSMRKRRRSSGISIASQPEGIYSPIPKSKILSELNQSIHGIECAQSPISLNKENKDKKDKKEEKEYISSELSQSIRNEVLAEIEKMDIETSKQIKDNYLLLNPSPSSLLSKMSKLKISDSNNISNITTSNHHHFNQQKVCNVEEIQKMDRNHDINDNKKNYFKRILMKYCCNKEIWLNILNFIWILFVLVLYCNVIDFQWK